eukprot:TRINITY_DN36390_c0_g1_i1.p1 TRINITY_DN36390_c0_g1~~TRINITY_DN36390_c0_g1_i1.p1  ORF type:complete len:903 (+),score=270.00 TRINITY_DN36390_c0_g1_i1:57-2711(+)
MHPAARGVVTPRPIRRPQLAAMPQDTSLPPVPELGTKPRMRKAGVASYDVGLVAGSSGPLPAPGRANVAGFVHMPRPPGDRGRAARRARTLPSRTEPSESEDEQEGEERRKRRAQLSTFPSTGLRGSWAKPALLVELEEYLSAECSAVERDLGEPPEPGSQLRYRIYRNALEKFKQTFQTYDEVLSRIVREFDEYVDKNFVPTSELVKLRREVEGEKRAKEDALRNQERQHKDELRQVVRKVQQTRIDNLLSVDMERLQQKVRDLEHRVERLSWENRQLIERNGALSARLQESIRGEPLADDKRESADGARMSFPPGGAAKLDSFVNNLGKCLMLSLRALEERRREEAQAMHPATVNSDMQKKLAELRAELADAQAKMQELRHDRDSARRHKHAAEKGLKRMKDAAETGDDGASRFAIATAEMEKRAEKAEHALARERARSGEQLVRMQQRMSRMQELTGTGSAAVSGLLVAELRAAGRQGLYGYGSGSDVPRWLRSAVSQPLPFVLPSYDEAVEAARSFFQARLKHEETGLFVPPEYFLLLHAKVGDSDDGKQEAPQWLGALEPARQATVYTLLHAAQRYEYESPDLSMFLACMHGRLSADCWADGEGYVEAFSAALSRLAAEGKPAGVAACRAVAEVCGALPKQACAAIVASLCSDPQASAGPAPGGGLSGWGTAGSKTAQLLRMQHFDGCRGFALQIEERVRELSRQRRKRDSETTERRGWFGAPRDWGNPKPPKDDAHTVFQPSQLVALVRELDPEHPREPLQRLARVCAMRSGSSRRRGTSPGPGSLSPGAPRRASRVRPSLTVETGNSPRSSSIDEEAPLPVDAVVSVIRTQYVWRRCTPLTHVEDLLPLVATSDQPSAGPAADAAPARTEGFEAGLT